MAYVPQQAPANLDTDGLRQYNEEQYREIARAWAELEASTAASAAPSDGSVYGRVSGAWGKAFPIYATVAAFVAATVLLADDTIVYIQNYYAGVDGGGHQCRIKSVAPSHTAYHVSANGKYAVLAESNPWFRMFGALPDGSNATPQLDMWQDYCDATGVCSLNVEPGGWSLLTRPRPIYTKNAPWGRIIRGQGTMNTTFYTNYATWFYYGVFHLLPNANGGGLTLEDLGIISSRTDSANGAAIATHCGYVNELVIGGTINVGDVLTATIAGTSVTYTVVGGDTKKTIAEGLTAAILGNATIFNALNLPVAWQDRVVLMSKTSAPPTITTGTTGTTTVTRTAIGAMTSGYMFLDNLNITSSNGWNYSLNCDGMRYEGVGARSIFATGCNFFGASIKSVQLLGVINAHFSGCETILAGGASGTLRISGISTSFSQQIHWDGGYINDIEMDFCSGITIVAGRIQQGITNTANTDHVKITAGHIVTAGQTNWTNSAYL